MTEGEYGAFNFDVFFEYAFSLTRLCRERLAAARARSGSDSHLGCHSIPSRRFTTSRKEPSSHHLPKVTYSLRAEKEKYGASVRSTVNMCDLNLTPSELKTQVFSHYVLCFAFAKRSRSNFVRLACASTDSLALHYLRRRSLCERRCKGGKSFLLRRINKKRQVKTCRFLAEKKGFEPSRRLPDLHP